MEKDNNVNKVIDNGSENPQPQVTEDAVQDAVQDTPQPQVTEDAVQDAVQDTPQPQKKNTDDFLNNLFAVTEEVPEKKELPENTEKIDAKDEYYKASEADKKFLADMLVTAINFVFNFTVLELAMKLGDEQIQQLKLKDAEKEMLGKAYTRMIKQYELADKINPFVTFLIANFMVYGRITKDAIKLKKNKKEQEEKQKQAQVKIARKIINTDSLTEALNEQKIIPINEVAEKYLKKDNKDAKTKKKTAQDKTAQDKTVQDKTVQDKTVQDKTVQDKKP